MSMVQDIDHGWNTIVREMQVLDGKEIKAGIFGGTSKNGTDMVDIAIWNEFGVNIPVTDKMRRYLGSQGFHLKQSTSVLVIPSRPFMRRTANKNERKWNKLSRELLGQVLDSAMSTEAMLGQIGNVMVGDIQDTIIRGRYKRNHPYTKKQKKSSNPLVDTGQLHQAVTFKVE